jgi:hypothetical protein
MMSDMALGQMQKTPDGVVSLREKGKTNEALWVQVTHT